MTELRSTAMPGEVSVDHAVAGQRVPMYALLAANAVSQIGNMMLVVAGPWFVLETTGSAAKTGIVGAALAVGAVIPPFLGGPVIDWLGFKRGSVLPDIVSAASVGAMPLLHMTGLLQFWPSATLVGLGVPFSANRPTTVAQGSSPRLCR